jgi:cytoskeletal protein CcmA (bactofilin family)
MSNNNEHSGNIVIGEGVAVNGTLKVPGKATVNGTLEGELVADELTVGPKGSVLGKVHARLADVHGKTYDSITASEHLIVRSTGQIHGTASYGKIEMERGGLISGSINPIAESSAAPPATAPLAGDVLPTLTFDPTLAQALTLTTQAKGN